MRGRLLIGSVLLLAGSGEGGRPAAGRPETGSGILAALDAGAGDSAAPAAGGDDGPPNDDATADGGAADDAATDDTATDDAAIDDGGDAGLEGAADGSAADGSAVGIPDGGAAICEGACAVVAALACPGMPPCVPGCLASLEGPCQAVALALQACIAGKVPADLTCGPSGHARLRPGVCADEQTALTTCLFQP